MENGAAGSLPLITSPARLGVWAKNERAQAFCQRFGFGEIGWPELHLGQDVQTALTLRKGMAGR
ncbi:MAG TPA: hypothetical protein VF630_18775 [Hymenobacter sp.]